MAKTNLPIRIGQKSLIPKRHRKVLRDSIYAITKPAIRRLARRGGVTRMSESIYDEIRVTLRNRLEQILKEVAEVVVHCNRKTVFVSDIVFVLKRMGNTIYGFDDVYKALRASKLKH